MQTEPDDSFTAALFRILSTPAGFSAIGLYRDGAPAPRLVAASPAYRALPVPEDIRLPTEAPGPVIRLDPARLGLASGFAAAARVSGRGWLVVADRRALRLTLRRVERLLDAARLASAGLVAPTPPEPARPSAGRTRSAARRLIDAALTRYGSGQATLMMLDVDRFRSVNEALGAAAGDALLASTARRLERALASEGRLLRLDGDRFVVVAGVGAGGAAAFARRLLDALNRPLRLDGRVLVVQASIGVVAGLRDGVPVSLLLTQADAALRRAKTEGRNRFVLHEPAEAVAALETTRLELDLAGALADGQFHPVYQPFVDVTDGRVCGVEALLRWRHPTRGTLLPTAFIPMAEATGQILPLGQWALRRALAQAVRWQTPITLAVNISPLQFHQPGFLAEVDQALAESGFPPGRLELEITETVLMRDNPETTGLLRALIARGIRIALDDFGTGYSALAYLTRLPHHRIKLDKVFVQDLGNPQTANLIAAILALARAQGVAVTAEGVETPQHLDLVRRMGFSHAQGYAIGAPVPEPAILAQACPA